VVAVEDSPHGIAAATDAGMFCIALRGDGNAEADLTSADVIAEDSEALRRALDATL
jgi:beta-phosphoglucomutase-like phosphatase (HAD superfamily)